MATATRPPNAGQGRVKGVPNKLTRELREMILGALDELGGQAWLVEQAKANPAAFLTLLGKVLPTTINASLSVQPGIAERLKAARDRRQAALGAGSVHQAALQGLPACTPRSPGNEH